MVIGFGWSSMMNIQLQFIQTSEMDDEKHPESSAEIQSLKNLLTQILHNNSAYDCMPTNSSINSIDKSMSLYDGINLLINKDLEELLIWDQDKGLWIWMLTLVDAIRFITHALKSLVRRGFVDFSDFQKQKEKGAMISEITECSKIQLQQVIIRLQSKSIDSIINEITHNSPAKNYIRLKSVQKEAKISFVILAMTVQKIHRIVVEDSESHMMISVLNFKDIFLYIMGIANESNETYNYGAIGIQSLLQASDNKVIQIDQAKPLWEAFEIMTDREKSLWINVVDSQRRFKGMLFREDFRGIFQGWHVEYMWMSVEDFIQWKKATENITIPEYRFFEPSENTRDILWKMIMSRRNAIVWVDKEHRVQTTIGLLEVFRLYLN